VCQGSKKHLIAALILKESGKAELWLGFLGVLPTPQREEERSRIKKDLRFPILCCNFPFLLEQMLRNLKAGCQ